jgi:hypothetical protein
MGGALQGIGTPTGYPIPQALWGLNPPLTGQFGVTTPFGPYVPQQLQQLQVAVHQLLQNGFVQQQHLQQLLLIVPQQLQQIQQLVQFVAQQASQLSPFHQIQPFLPNATYPMTAFGPSSGWLGSSPATQPQLYGAQGGFGGQSGYVM